MVKKKKESENLVKPVETQPSDLICHVNKRHLDLKFFKTRKAGLILIALYLLFGLFIAKDYGMSFDESYERETSLVTYNYVMRLENSNSEAVRNFAESIPPFELYPEKHGTALHFPLVAIEHIFNFELPTQTVYLMRHIFVFLNYILAAFCFYGIIWRRFPKTYMPFLSVLLFILYPRFFAESFYNNKDILFYSWYIISVYAALHWLEKPALFKTLIAGVVLALAANTRILALSILLLAIAFYIVRALLNKRKALEIIITPTKLLAVFLVAYTIVTPQTWKSPITGIIDIFVHFLHFAPWDGRHFYLGQWITREVPWHYIPVWIGITSPLLYVVLFIFGTVAYLTGLFRNKAKLRYMLCENMYDSFFMALFWCTLLGFIGFGIYMYNGWRHAYSIFSSFLYISVYGLNSGSEFLRSRHKYARYIAKAAVTVSMLATTVWLVLNHPYQYVYFNFLTSQYAKENFDLDYWGVSGNSSLNYILESDSREYITVMPPHPSTWYKLNEQDKKRLVWLENPLSWADFHWSQSSQLNHPYSPDYIVPYIQGNIIPQILGYREIHDTKSGGITLSRLYKNVALDAFDDQAYENILSISGAIGNGNYAAMFDDSPKTRWTTNAPQRAGDYIQFEFKDLVQYNLFRLDVGSYLSDYIQGRIFVSSDGKDWSEAKIIWHNCIDYLIESLPYRYLRIINDEPDGNYWCSICQLRFGNTVPQWYK